MKRMVIAVCLLMLVGCSPTLIVRPDGSIEAKSYAIVQQADGKKSYIPRPWYELGFLSTILKALQGVVK